MHTIPFFKSKNQYHNIKKKLFQRLKPFLEKQHFILGEQVKIFEESYSKYLNTKYAIGVGSGTDALILSLKALNIAKGDEIIIPTNTFISSALACIRLKAKPVFVDCDNESYQIDTKDVEKKITSKTKVIIPTHMYGAPCDMDKITKLAQRHNLQIIEDACQAHGGTFNQQKVGTIGDIGVFSFYPVKNLGAYGDGGIVVTDNKKIAEKIKTLRNYGARNKYFYNELGYNSRLDEIQALILQIKLQYLDQWNKRRNYIAKYYKQNLIKVKTQRIIDDTYSAYHIFIIEVHHREKFIKYMDSNRIQVLIHYPLPLHLQNCFKKTTYKLGDFPNAEQSTKKIVSLPIYPELKDHEIEYIIEKVNRYNHNKI